MDRQTIFQYVNQQYATEPEYLWMKYPSYAVLRRQDSQKWYGIVMDVPREKLGLPGTGTVDILDVKCEPMAADLLRQCPGFPPRLSHEQEHLGQHPAGRHSIGRAHF